MRQEWSPDELVSAWTLVDEDRPLVGNKAGATRLGFSLLPSAPRCTRWSRREPCASWSARPRPTSARSRRGCGWCCARPTPITTGRCCPPCSERWRSAATTPSTSRSCRPWPSCAAGRRSRARPASTTPPARSRSRVSSRPRGATPWSTSRVGSSASPTSCASWSRCATPCAAERFTSPATDTSKVSDPRRTRTGLGWPLSRAGSAVAPRGFGSWLMMTARSRSTAHRGRSGVRGQR